MSSSTTIIPSSTTTLTTKTMTTATATTTKTTTPGVNETHRQALSSRANVFLLVNLGCEMLYVIDQRLKAQQIAVDKSIQVIHDITAVLLDPKFIDSIILGSTHGNSQLLTADHCKFMLNDIAMCSLMRLDHKSMEKLWNLMTVIYKWQLFVSRHQHHLLDITFRHLNSVAKLYPDDKRNLLIDFTKNTLLDFWNTSDDDGQLAIYQTNKSWLECFDTKISLLIRLGFQAQDGSFIRDVQNSYYREFVDTIGENIYTKSVELAEEGREQLTGIKRIDPLAELLNLTYEPSNEDLQPIDVCNFQRQFEQNLQQCNILFDDLDVNGINKKENAVKSARVNSLDLNLFPDSSIQRTDDEFVRLKPQYSRNTEAAGIKIGNSGSNRAGLNRDLLDLYSKMN